MATGRIGTTPVLQVRWSKAPTGGTTSLSGLDDNSVSLVYSVGYEAVYQNGVLLSRGNDYTATNGTTITLTTATVAGDIIEVFANQTIPLTDTYSQTVANSLFVNQATFDAKGDLIAGTADNTYSRLAVGTNGQVLTAASTTSTGLSWTTPASGGMTQLATGSLNGTASVTISSISTSYVDLVLYCYAVNTNGNGCFFRVNGDSNANYGGLYHRFYNNALGGNAYNTSGFTSLINSTGETTPDNNATGNVVLEFPNYAVTTGTKNTRCLSYWVSNGGYKTVAHAVHAYTGTAAAITSIEIFTGGGNFTGGTYVLYGVK